MLLKIGLLAIAYLVGAIPFSVIFGMKLKGIDVRKHGSGNPGGTNSLRFLGKKVGILVILADISKGALFVALVKYGFLGDTDLYFHPLMYGTAATLGHAFSIYINFRGGKAVGTSAGMIIAYNPLLALFAAVFFFAGLKISKFVSIGSTCGAIGVVFAAIVFKDYDLLFYGLVITALIIFRHQTNYKNIMKKVEPRIYWIDGKKNPNT